MDYGHPKVLSNLVPRLSSLRSSLEEETLVNAGHVASRFWEPAYEGWCVVVLMYVILVLHLTKSVTKVTFTQIMNKSSPN